MIDIIKRLHEWQVFFAGKPCAERDMREAIDEIMRLRNVLERIAAVMESDDFQDVFALAAVHGLSHQGLDVEELRALAERSTTP